MSENREERREYVRATLSTQIRIKVIDEEEFQRVRPYQPFTELPFPPLTGENVADESQSGDDAQSTHILQWLIHIDEKLNRILQKLEPEQATAEATCLGETRNISGVGVKVVLDRPIPIGQKVLISLSLPGFTMGTFQAYGEVVRAASCEDKGEKAFEISIKFIIIDETEREKLIAYSFYEQRKAIREAVKNKENHRGKG